MDGFGPDGVRVNPELEYDSYKFDEFVSDHDSDLDDPRYNEFNAETDMVNPKFVKGLIFYDRKGLMDAVDDIFSNVMSETMQGIYIKISRRFTKKLNPAQWSKSHFDTRTKCDMLLNNLCVEPHVLVEKGIKFMLALDTNMLWILCNVHVHAENET
ncbi:hypothetical protein V6N13_001245 [Hibiscus sabdariffa]